MASQPPQIHSLIPHYNRGIQPQKYAQIHTKQGIALSPYLEV